MDTHAKKLDLIAWLLRLQDEEVLKKIESLRSGTDFWDELTAEEQKEIEGGVAELDAGEKYPYKEIIAPHRKS